TDRSLAAPVELGAAWLGNASANPIVDLLDEAGGRSVPWDWQEGMLVGSDGERWSRERVRALGERLRRLVEIVEREKARAPPRATQAWAVDRALDAMGAAGAEREALRYSASLQLGMFQGADLDDLALAAYGEEKDMPGEDRLVATGLDAVVARLAEGLDVRLRIVARAVRQDERGVRVETSDTGEWRARRAI